MKKLSIIFLSLLLTVCLCACSTQSAAKAKSLDLDKAKQQLSSLELFPSMTEIDEGTMSSVFGIDPSLVTEYAAGFPLMNVHASMYWVVLPAEGKADEVKSAFASYFDDYQKMWDQYLPDQAQLTRDRLETEIETEKGTYLVYVISEDNDKALEAINSALVN